MREWYRTKKQRTRFTVELKTETSSLQVRNVDASRIENSGVECTFAVLSILLRSHDAKDSIAIESWETVQLTSILIQRRNRFQSAVLELIQSEGVSGTFFKSSPSRSPRRTSCGCRLAKIEIEANWHCLNKSAAAFHVSVFRNTCHRDTFHSRNLCLWEMHSFAQKSQDDAMSNSRLLNSLFSSCTDSIRIEELEMCHVVIQFCLKTTRHDEF